MILSERIYRLICRERLEASLAKMTESEFTVARSVGFVAAVAVAMSLQHLTPHARLRGSWRINVALWAITLLVIVYTAGGNPMPLAR